MKFKCGCGGKLSIKDKVSVLKMCESCGEMYTVDSSKEKHEVMHVSNQGIAKTFGKCKTCGDDLIKEEVEDGVCMICSAIMS